MLAAHVKTFKVQLALWILEGIFKFLIFGLILTKRASKHGDTGMTKKNKKTAPVGPKYKTNSTAVQWGEIQKKDVHQLNN